MKSFNETFNEDYSICDTIIEYFLTTYTDNIINEAKHKGRQKYKTTKEKNKKLENVKQVCNILIKVKSFESFVNEQDSLKEQYDELIQLIVSVGADEDTSKVNIDKFDDSKMSEIQNKWADFKKAIDNLAEDEQQDAESGLKKLSKNVKQKIHDIKTSWLNAIKQSKENNEIPDDIADAKEKQYSLFAKIALKRLAAGKLTSNSITSLFSSAKTKALSGLSTAVKQLKRLKKLDNSDETPDNEQTDNQSTDTEQSSQQNDNNTNDVKDLKILDDNTLNNEILKEVVKKLGNDDDYANKLKVAINSKFANYEKLDEIENGSLNGNKQLGFIYMLLGTKILLENTENNIKQIINIITKKDEE